MIDFFPYYWESQLQLGNDFDMWLSTLNSLGFFEFRCFHIAPKIILPHLFRISKIINKKSIKFYNNSQIGLAVIAR